MPVVIARQWRWYRPGGSKWGISWVVPAVAIATLSGCILWSRPERAETNPYEVWISLIKPFGRVVYYVGTDEPYAYFRIGRVFVTYYRAPSCNFTLPRMFTVGADKPYVVSQGNVRGYSSSPTCEPPHR